MKRLNPLNEIGTRVRSRRIRLGWSQAELARRAGFTTGYVSEIERGLRVPSLQALFDLAGALKVAPAALVPGHALTERLLRRRLEQIIDLAGQLREMLPGREGR